MKQLSVAAFICLLVVVGVTPQVAQAAVGIDTVGAELSTAAAGYHPDFTTSLVLEGETRLEDATVQLPPGLVGNLNVVAQCDIGEFRGSSFSGSFGTCPVDSQIGVVKVLPSGFPAPVIEPLYNLKPPHPNQEIAKLGFYGGLAPIFIDVLVRTSSDYGVSAAVHDSTGLAPVELAETTIWGVPADPIHNKLRLTPFEAALCPIGTACLAPGEERPSGLPKKPLLDNPTACQDQQVAFAVTSYQLPGQLFTASAPLPPITGCEALSFQPSFHIEPNSHAAGEPTGLTTTLHIPQNEAVNLPATSAMRAAKVTLPEGMTINSAAAEGLEACSDQQVGLGNEAESHCPDGSRLGSATFVSSALPKAIQGAVYQRSPEPGHLFRLWLVTDELGLHLKLPGEVHADPNTGRLTADFVDTPQLPVEEIELQFKGGPQAPLKNPRICGFYSASYQFTPWSGNSPVTGETQKFTVDQSCGSGGFSPNLQAGVQNPIAGSFSPLVLDMTLNEGDQNLSSFDLTLPPGLLAKLKGVPLCSDAQAGTGGCTTNSQIGRVHVAAGAGPEPLWLPQPGKKQPAMYLAGQYRGAPYSAVTEVPVQAGPFDLGTVSVRSGIYVDPDTAQATIKTDPLPQILEGVPILYRRIHAEVDRSQFAIAPTNCKEMRVESSVISAQGSVAHPSDRFQVGECAALSFRPKLSLNLRGGTRRGSYPALTATLTTGKNEANIRRTSVALPHSEFLAQNHINTVCTRVQFSEEKCPRGSIYGFARAITPLLAQPLEGPVYLRSSSHPLPDLVVALHGQFDINLVGRIDSVHGGIRTTFESVPDAPVSKFILKMKGGKKSLLVNSQNICAGRHRAVVKMGGQNGRVHDPHPLLQNSCGG